MESSTRMNTALATTIFATLTVAASATAADLTPFEKQLAPYTEKPAFVAPGPSFDAAKCMKGKSIFAIPASSANPFNANIVKSMQALAKKVGFNFTVWENQGQPAQWAQGMDNAIAKKVDLIDLLAGADPRVLVPQVKAAQAAGIPVIATHYAGMEQGDQVKAFADGDVPVDYAKAGALLVDWGIVRTGGKMNALVLISTGPMSTDSMLNGIKQELQKCPGCKATYQNYALTDWGTRITPGVQAALLADPSINYILVLYDSMAQFVVPAVSITGTQDRVKIGTFNGTPFAIGLVQKGQIDMDIGENLDWIAHAMVDNHMRRICGLPANRDAKIPFRIFTKQNAGDAGEPPQVSQGYGDAYVKGFRELWQLK